MNVAAIQLPRDDQGQGAAEHRQRHHRRVLGRQREQQRQTDQAGTHRVAEAIEAHVDDRLRRPLFVGRHGRIENLVAGSK